MGTVLSSINIVYVCVVPVSMWVDLSYGSADRDRCPLPIPIIHTAPPLNSNLLTTHPNNLSGHTETLNWATLWEWGASWRWCETHGMKPRVWLVTLVTCPPTGFSVSCHFYCLLSNKGNISSCLSYPVNVCMRKRHVNSLKGKEIKVSKQT